MVNRSTVHQLDHLRREIPTCSVVITCTRKFEPDYNTFVKRLQGMRYVIQEKVVDEGANRIAMREVIMKLENMIVFGRTFHRYFVDESRERSRIHLFYSKEERCLCWCSRGMRNEHATRKMPLQDITDIVIGKQTRAFLEAGDACADDCCFTIIAGHKKNVLNLAAAQSKTRDVWVFAVIKLLNEFDMPPVIHNPGKYHTAAHAIQEADELDATEEKYQQMWAKLRTKSTGIHQHRWSAELLDWLAQLERAAAQERKESMASVSFVSSHAGEDATTGMVYGTPGVNRQNTSGPQSSPESADSATSAGESTGPNSADQSPIRHAYVASSPESSVNVGPNPEFG